MRGQIPTKILALCHGALPAALCALVALPTLVAVTTSTANAQGLVLEEITVTAQRREENIVDVPISVTAVSGERLTALFEGGEDIRALATRLPSLYAESSNGRVAPRFYMRGLGNTDFDLAASQSVSLIIDEVVQENVILKSFPIFDVERVEVLRGPQGTLFGRNTPAGIIKFDSRKPSEAFNAYALATVGTLGTMNVEGAIGGALNDAGTVMGRFSVLSQNRDDWIDNSFTGQKDAIGSFSENAWRGQLMLEASEDLSLLLNVHGRDYDGTASIFRANVLTTGSNEFNGNYDRDSVAFNEGANNPQTGEAYGGSLKVDLDFDNGVSLTSITAIETAESFSRGDIDGGNPGGPGFIPFQSQSADAIDDLEQFTQEVRLAGESDDGFFWQTGFYYFDGDFTVTTNPFFIPPTSVTHSNTAWAVFGQVSVPLTDRLTVIGGMRYTDDEKELRSDAINDRFLEGEQTSFDASAVFSVSDDTNIYARLANGFRAPSIQGRDAAFGGQASTADSETIMSYELGLKTTLADGRVRMNAALFRYVVDDQQFTAVGGASNLIQLVNADEGVGKGFDMDIEVLLTDNLLITAGFSHVNTQIKDPSLALTPCGSGQCTVVNDLDANGNALVHGNSFPGAPDNTIAISARYSQPTDSGELFVFTDWARQGRTDFFLYETLEYYTDGNFEGGIRAGYIHGDDEWELAVFGRNITDEENMKGGIEFNNNTAFDNEPRVWGITFRKNWGS